METIKRVQQGWELEKKAELIKLGQGSKPYPEILSYLENEIENSGRMTNFDYKIPCFMNDGVYQLNRAIEEIIGVATAKADKKPSGGGDQPINTVDITLADGSTRKVPYGDIELPDMGENANIKIFYNYEQKVLHVRGCCQFKFNSLIDNIINKTKFLLNTDSVYKNQTFEINAEVDSGQPKIISLENLDKETMILSEETEYSLSPLYARLLHTEECKKNGIPIRFGALMESPYGCGKTLLMFKLARLANQNGFAAIYLKSPELLADTLRMARTLDHSGNGILCLVEDIDQVTRGDRDAALQDILNTIDGGDNKDMNVISLFTTNHIELIEPTFLRGKRIGTIISMGYLDAKTSEKYIQEFCKDITLEGDFSPVYEKIVMSNIAPAFMAEIIENVKSNMVVRGDTSIKASHFIACINSYLRQVGLSKTKDTSTTPEKALASALIEVIHNDTYFKKVDEIFQEVWDRQ